MRRGAGGNAALSAPRNGGGMSETEHSRHLREARGGIYGAGKGNERGGGKKRSEVRRDVQPAHRLRLSQNARDHRRGRDREAAARHLDHHRLVPFAVLLRYGQLARHVGGRGRRRAHQSMPAPARSHRLGGGADAQKGAGVSAITENGTTSRWRTT